MRLKQDLKNTIRNLRSGGATYGEINKSLHLFIPKSTLSYVCRNVQLPDDYAKKIKTLNLKNAEKARKIALIINAIKRKEYLKILNDRNKYLIKKLDRSTFKIALSMLYLGEGSKWRTHRGLMLGSSDPEIILIYIHLLNICYNINRAQLHCRVQYRADQNINKLQRYWSKTTGISINNFYKTKVDPRTIGKITKKKDYMGVCVISCGGTEIQLELEIISKLILRACSLEAKR